MLLNEQAFLDGANDRAFNSLSATPPASGMSAHLVFNQMGKGSSWAFAAASLLYSLTFPTLPTRQVPLLPYTTMSTKITAHVFEYATYRRI
jgi:hypothetical protein